MEVDAFNDPLEVISKFRSNKYKLAIIDVRMPKMNGIELSRKFVKLDPNLKICFLTAFESVHEDIKKQFPELSKCYFLKKTYFS